jgi:hypothetical protein
MLSTLNFRDETQDVVVGTQQTQHLTAAAQLLQKTLEFGDCLLRRKYL